MNRRLRIFLSSPGDVADERLRANLVIQKLARDYIRFFDIEPYLWEHEPMLASGHFQDAIEPPSSSDIVILIVYSRLGTSLPEQTTVRAYQGIDGRAPVTGTEWEFEEALAAFRTFGAPDLLAYRKIGDPGTSLVDAARRQEQERQWTALESFWRRHFEDGGLFIAGSARFETLEEFDAKLENDLVRLIERRIAKAGDGGEAEVQQTWRRGSPFRGLVTYEFEDAPIFFGRDGQIRAAASRLQAAAENGAAFLLVLGASGAGKSSLARAGILPMLFAPKAVAGVGLWRRVILRPGEGGDPVAALARALTAGNPAAGVGLPEILSAGLRVESLVDHLVAAPDDPSFPFRVALERVRDDGRKRGLLPHEHARLVILVDQFEELFTAQIEPVRRDLFVRILAGLARSGVVWVVGTIRNDLWHRAAETPALLALVEAGARMDLLRPDSSEIIEILRRPAASAGLAFEVDSERGVGLDAVISAAAAEEPGVLPLISVLLETLYERDVAAASNANARILTFATYRDLGELKGAVSSRADQVLGSLANSDPEAALSLPNVLRALVVVRTGQNAITSRPARMDGFAPGGPEARLVARFLAPDARLLVASGAESGAEIRLAHEALLTHWPNARKQIETDRRDLEIRGRLEALHHRWEQFPSRPEKARALLTGLNLMEGIYLSRRWKLDSSSALGNFISISKRADSRRRRRVGLAAAALVLIFALIATLAGLQWRRAEDQAAIARGAEATEREARALSEKQRAEAIRQKERADVETARALAALDATKLESARTLAVQSERAIADHDIRRALANAVQAGQLEREVQRTGAPRVGEAALLKATAAVREELHVQRPSAGWLFPHVFIDDNHLAYADPKAGLVVVDLRNGAHISSSVPLPEGMSPMHLGALGSSNLIAVSGGERLLIVDAANGAVRADVSFPERIAALDTHDGSQTIAVAAGSEFALVRLDGAEPVRVAVPGAGPNRLVGQVRFDKFGDQLFVSTGTTVATYDLRSGQFVTAPFIDLGGARLGYETAQLDELLGKGLLAIVEMVPDLVTGTRVLLRTELDLRAIDLKTGAVTAYDEDARGVSFIGIGTGDQSGVGSPQELIAVLARRNENDVAFQLSYLTETDGRPRLLAFESFSVASSDLAGEKPWSCQVSPRVRHLACQYWGNEKQGIVVWRLLRGNHLFERVIATGANHGPRLSSGLMIPGSPPRLLATRAEGGLVVYEGEAETKVGDLGPEWTLSSFAQPYVAALAPSLGQGQVLRSGEDDRAANPVLGPLPASDVLLDAGSEQAVFVGPDSLVLYNLASAQTVWTVPGLAGLRGAVLSGDGARIGAISASTAQVFDAATGDLLASRVIDAAGGAPFAFNTAADRITFTDAEGVVQIVGLLSGETVFVAKPAQPITQLAWSRDGGILFIGARDGAVSAVDRGGRDLWTIPTPLGHSFRDSDAWPGQPPRGAVHVLAPSGDGRRLAIIRQDIPAIDFHETVNGRHLTQLTPPWSYGVPARVSFEADDLVLSHWAVQAMLRDAPGYVAIHRLPENFDAALSTAQARLNALSEIWSPEGPPGVHRADAGSRAAP